MECRVVPVTSPKRSQKRVFTSNLSLNPLHITNKHFSTKTKAHGGVFLITTEYVIWSINQKCH